MNLTILLRFHLNIRGYQLITLAMNIDDFDTWIILQVLTQLGDVNVHRTCVEVIVVDPYGLQGEVTLQDFVGMSAKETEEIAFLRGQLD